MEFATMTASQEREAVCSKVLRDSCGRVIGETRGIVIGADECNWKTSMIFDLPHFRFFQVHPSGGGLQMRLPVCRNTSSHSTHCHHFSFPRSWYSHECIRCDRSITSVAGT